MRTSQIDIAIAQLKAQREIFDTAIAILLKLKQGPEKAGSKRPQAKPRKLRVAAVKEDRPA